jgi:hypothetical protein
MLSELFDFCARIREIRGCPAGVHIEAFAEQLFSARLLEDFHPPPHSVCGTHRSMGSPSGLVPS